MAWIPVMKKWLFPVLLILYVVSPWDALPEVFLPGVGYIDDLVLVLLYTMLQSYPVVQKILASLLGKSKRNPRKKKNDEGPILEASWEENPKEDSK